VPCVVQRAWRCFYARVTLFYLKQHKKYVKLALKESNVTRIGSMVVPRKLVRQHLKCVFSHSSDCRVRPAVTVECIMDFPLLVVDVSSHGPINWQRLVSLHLNLCRSSPENLFRAPFSGPSPVSSAINCERSTPNVESLTEIKMRS
jgi:hypothetical protein